ncbi:MAG TPA: ATP-binding protein [Puia sp.]|jgi:signal transduction histidine kinase/CheY-like chemotaxis protein/HPt (histidine-containing phosphotransfer) domain-containing protein|nr:ATP-binding protein [Puia sp.]
MTSNRFIYFILSAFIAGNLLLIFMQYNSVKNINNLIGGNEKLLHELQVSNQLREMERDLLSTESKIRGAIATSDTSYLKEIDIRIAETKRYLDSLKVVSDQDSTLMHIERLNAIADEKLALKNRVLDSFHHTGKISSESFKNILKPRMHTNDETNDLSFKLTDSRQRLLDSLSISISRSGKKARTLGTVMIIVVLLSEAGLFWYIISRIKRQNHLIQELDASEKKVREVSMIKENFMANMSHEIRTPMNAILGFINLLRTKNQYPELTEFIESIRKAGENLLAIINDILDISKIEAGMIRIESVSFSIRELIHSIQMLFTEKLNEKGLNLSCSIEDSVPDTLSGDATRLTQILVNMIGNAVKFTSKGTISIAVNNQGVTGKIIRIGFVISDTGIGIAREKLSGIFERFKQAEDSITRKYGGTGLGLSIAKDLILLQKGEIDVDSEPGKGTTFRFVIPYEITSTKLKVSKLPGAVELEYPDRQYLHILVVDDNEMNQNLLRHLLKGWKLSFDIVNNGVEALEMLKTRIYNLVLMDIQMPEMDGYTATEEIRLKLKLDIPIIAMTAHAFAGEREKCLRHGMNEYIAKPISENKLYLLINELTGGVKEARSFKDNLGIEDSSPYQYVNLEYMREISGGDKQYERTVTGQFIEAIPVDLEMLESAFVKKDLAKLHQTAHEMKTNVSVMGLSERLHPYLDELEYELFDEAHFEQIILSIKTICMQALPEARHFYSTI